LDTWGRVGDTADRFRDFMEVEVAGTRKLAASATEAATAVQSAFFALAANDGYVSDKASGLMDAAFHAIQEEDEAFLAAARSAIGRAEAVTCRDLREMEESLSFALADGSQVEDLATSFLLHQAVIEVDSALWAPLDSGTSNALGTLAHLFDPIPVPDIELYQEVVSENLEYVEETIASIC